MATRALSIIISVTIRDGVMLMGVLTCLKVGIGAMLMIVVKYVVVGRRGHANNIGVKVTTSTSSSLTI